MKIRVTRTSMPSFEEYSEMIKPLWDSHMLTNMGELHERFTHELEALLGCRVTLFSHGHSALEAALRVLGLPAGSKVVTTPFTFVSTVHAIVRAGLQPVFCDVLESDGTMDPECLEALMGPDVCAVLPVHVYGNPCDMDAIEAIARMHGARVLYDAAHAFGVKYPIESGMTAPAHPVIPGPTGDPVTSGAQSVDRRGDMSVLSFHATKVFSTVEGGAVCYRDEAYAQPLADERNFGIRDESHCEAVGGNSKLSELHAAMGL